MGADLYIDVQRPLAVTTLAREFPHVRVRAGDATDAARIDAAAWRSRSFDPFEFDRTIGDAVSGVPSRLQLVGGAEEAERIALEVLTRLQSALDRRNDASRTPLFDEVLVRHRALHDLGKPLVRADYDHALDVWQWLLRLDGEIDLETQVAALFHDIERLASEPDERVEHRAVDYQAFKDAHARTGAALARACLEPIGLGTSSLDRIERLITHHERPGDERERRLLNDADALSFFSLNSPGFLSYYGERHTRKKIDWSLARLSPDARARLSTIRFRDDVAELVNEALNVPERLGGAR